MRRTLFIKRTGFTLIELLVVIAILGALASIIFALTGNARVQGRDTKRVQDLIQVRTALEFYFEDKGTYPTMNSTNLAQNWSDLLDALKAGKYLGRAEEQFRNSLPPPTFIQKALAWLKITPAYAALNTRIQDPLYPSQSYGYMPSITPIAYNNFRIRAKFENLSNPLLKTSFSGKFFYSDEDPVNNPGLADNECAPLAGYYCMGPALNDSSSFSGFDPGKPVIYLYPEYATKVDVHISPKSIEKSVPEYGNGWSVMAHPNGDIFNPSTGQTYPYLYWEGTSNRPRLDQNIGNVIPTENILSFLTESLKAQGLNKTEADEFIKYWAPRITTPKPYTYIYFMPQSDYDALVPMKIIPTPKTVIRLYMLWKPLQEKVAVTPQTFSAPARKGFTVVEWGGDRSPIH